MLDSHRGTFDCESKNSLDRLYTCKFELRYRGTIYLQTAWQLQSTIYDRNAALWRAEDGWGRRRKNGTAYNRSTAGVPGWAIGEESRAHMASKDNRGYSKHLAQLQGGTRSRWMRTMWMRINASRHANEKCILPMVDRPLFVIPLCMNFVASRGLDLRLNSARLDSGYQWNNVPPVQSYPTCHMLGKIEVCAPVSLMTFTIADLLEYKYACILRAPRKYKLKRRRVSATLCRWLDRLWEDSCQSNSSQEMTDSV